MMRAVQITAPGAWSLIETDVPVPGPDDLLIKVEAAGICGTDVHIFHGEYEARYPIIPGHEFAGTVAAVGARVTRFRIGDRVTADPNVPCNRCAECQRGHANQCVDLQAVGVTRSGAFAEYVVAPEANTFSIDGLTFPQGAMVEPLACVVWGLKRVAIEPGDSVLVCGAGPMGCLLLQAVRHAGAASLVVTDRVADRLKIAAALGATETLVTPAGAAMPALDGKFDVVVDAIGAPAVLEAAIDLLKPRGRLWIFGVSAPQKTFAIPAYAMFRKDLTIVGSFAVNRTFHESIAMIRHGAIDVMPLVSNTFPLEQFGDAIALAGSDRPRMKVHLTTARA